MNDAVLVKLDAADRALAECKTVIEAKSIADVAETARIYLQRTRAGIEHVNRAVEIRLLAERQMGIFLGGMEKAKNRHSSDTTLVSLGITNNQSARAQKFGDIPEDVFRETITDAIARVGRVTVHAVVQALIAQPKQNGEGEEKLAGAAEDLSELDGQKFGTIYADPPWQFSNQATRAATRNHYVTMTVEEICALPVAALAAEQAHLHLWTTNAFLFECPKIFAAWGFEFKSSFVWVKPDLGIGNYWRNAHEILLLGVKGGLTARSRSERSWLECGRGPHSAKPEKIRESIERLSPGPYLELFARRAAPGWTVFGNEIERELV